MWENMLGVWSKSGWPFLYGYNTACFNDIIMSEGIPKGNILGPLLFPSSFTNIYTVKCLTIDSGLLIALLNRIKNQWMEN